jgi:hypothetical protein
VKNKASKRRLLIILQLIPLLVFVYTWKNTNFDEGRVIAVFFASPQRPSPHTDISFDRFEIKETKKLAKNCPSLTEASQPKLIHQKRPN